MEVFWLEEASTVQWCTKKKYGLLVEKGSTKKYTANAAQNSNSNINPSLNYSLNGTLDAVDIWDPIANNWRSQGTATLANGNVLSPVWPTIFLALFSPLIIGPRQSHACGLWHDAYQEDLDVYSDLIIVAGGSSSSGGTTNSSMADLDILEAFDVQNGTGNWTTMNPVGPNIPISNFGSSSDSISTFSSVEIGVLAGSGSAALYGGDRRNRFFWRPIYQQFKRSGGYLSRSRVRSKCPVLGILVCPYLALD